ncbi:MHO_4530 family protein [Mycoplasmopsis agassizii]|uniref:MHO_4530 family protein n=1 Tax=Mycoplasmopsis agassizii TaxID=33922 RepID=UPI0035295D91
MLQSFIILIVVLCFVALFILLTFLNVEWIYNSKIYGVSNLVFDLHNKRVSKMTFDPFNFGSFENGNEKDKFSKGYWIAYEAFFARANFNDEIKTKIKDILNNWNENQKTTQQIFIDNRQTNEKPLKVLNWFSFNKKNSIRIIFRQAEDNKIIANFKWSKDLVSQQTDYRDEILEWNQILNIRGTFKSFIGLEIKAGKRDNLKYLIKKLNSIYHRKKTYILLKNDLVFIMVNDQDLKLVKKHIHGILHAIKSENNGWFLRNFYSHLAVVEMKNVKFVDDLENLELRMRYALTESRADKETYWFEIDTIDFTEYEIFKSNVVNIMRELSSFDYDLKRIREYGTNKVLSNTYAKYKIKNVEKSEVENITKSIYYKNLINDFFVSYVEEHYKETRRIFIDIRDETFLSIGHNLKNTQVAYIINISDIDMIDPIEKFLKSNNFNVRLGVKLHSINERIFDFVMNVKPNFLVIAKEIGINISNEKNYLYLSYLNYLNNLNHTNMIIENVPANLEENIVKKTGLTYWLEN